MTDTQKYDLIEIDYSHEGWNGDLTTNMQKLDDHLHTRVLVTLGEAVNEGDALYQDTDGKWYKALADGNKQPARGLAVESGSADQQIRMQRIGPFQKTGWRFKVPYKLWLDDTVAGVLSHHKPATDAQCMGHAIASDTIFLDIQDQEEVGPAFFGTTTTQSTTSSSTTSSGTSTSSSTSSTTTESTTTSSSSTTTTTQSSTTTTTTTA